MNHSSKMLGLLYHWLFCLYLIRLIYDKGLLLDSFLIKLSLSVSVCFDVNSAATWTLYLPNSVVMCVGLLSTQKVTLKGIPVDTQFTLWNLFYFLCQKFYLKQRQCLIPGRGNDTKSYHGDWLRELNQAGNLFRMQSRLAKQSGLKSPGSVSWLNERTGDENTSIM